MKKNYYVPATEVVAFVGGAIMQAGSPTTIHNPNVDPIPDPNPGNQG